MDCSEGCPLKELSPGEPFFIVRAGDIGSASMAIACSIILIGKNNNAKSNLLMKKADEINNWHEQQKQKK